MLGMALKCRLEKLMLTTLVQSSTAAIVLFEHATAKLLRLKVVEDQSNYVVMTCTCLILPHSA